MRMAYWESAVKWIEKHPSVALELFVIAFIIALWL
jgi:hypothetical protein